MKTSEAKTSKPPGAILSREDLACEVSELVRVLVALSVLHQVSVEAREDLPRPP